MPFIKNTKTHNPFAMSFFEKLSNEFIDIIDWNDSTNDTLVYKFPRYQDEIKMGAQLTVRESQQAVFLNEGTIADVYMPGMYTLQTQNMPLLATLKGWKYGFDSPFKADVFFVSTRQFIDQKWGTKNPVTLSDPRFGFIELRAFGTFAFRVTDAGKFLKEVTGTDAVYTTEQVTGQLRSLMVNKFTDALGEANFPIEKLAANLEELSQLLQEKLNADFDAYGLKITRLVVENISMPDDVKREIFEYSRLNKVDMQKLTQFKMANSIDDAVSNGNGLAGAGVGFGMGMGMGNMFSQQMQNLQNTPPPLAPFFVAVNGQQTGPFTIEQLSEMITVGNVKRETLIWKNGMAQWAAAGTVAELNNAFSLVPPPPPPAV